MTNFSQFHMHDQNRAARFLLLWLLRITFLQKAKAQFGLQPSSAKCMPSAKLRGSLAGHYEMGSSEPKFTTVGQAKLRKQRSSCLRVICSPVCTGSFRKCGQRWWGAKEEHGFDLQADPCLQQLWNLKELDFINTVFGSTSVFSVGKHSTPSYKKH